MRYLFPTEAQLYKSALLFQEKMTPVVLDASSRLPDGADKDIVKSIPKGLLITDLKTQPPSAVVVVDPLEGFGIALKMLGRPAYQTTVPAPK